MKKTAIVLTMVLILNLLPLYANAVDVNESESNNTFATADITYNDYNNYGKISSSSDVDYWKITFTANGMANFYLDSGIGCDFDLYLYDSSQTLRAHSTTRGQGSKEIIRARVYQGKTYYVKIARYSGISTANYLFRSKRYDLKEAKLFTFQYTSNGIHGAYNTHGDGTYLQPKFWSMGYLCTEYLNNTATSGYNALKSAGIYYIHHHGMESCIEYYNETGIVGNYSGGDTSTLGLNTLPANSLDSLDLMLVVSCYVGEESTMFGEFVPTLLSKGAKNCITWKDKILTVDGTNWAKAFFAKIEAGRTVHEAIEYATNIMQTTAQDLRIVNSIYYGNSKTTATVLV